MAQICNKVETEEPIAEPPQNADRWTLLYRENERFVETGSAYFAQAFAEALGVVSDIELHDLERARLRLGVITTLLEHAVRQYDAGLAADARTGLEAFHEDRLRAAGLDFEGTVRTLRAARSQGYLVVSDDLIDQLAEIFSGTGYRAIMEHYLRKVRDIHNLVSEVGNKTSTMWQDLAWRLTSAFAHAMEFGQAIAVMNAAAYRSDHVLHTAGGD